MIVGHQRQWSFLKKAYREDSLSHAYLLTGEDQIGKKQTGLEFIKYVHCQGEKKPCGKCASCRMIKGGTHPDFLLVEYKEGRDIKVEQVDKLLRHLSLKPSLSKYKTALIDDAHLLNRYSQNSLLKTLEEPGGETLLLLITSRPYLLLQTILSRVQPIRFFPLSRKEMEGFLDKKGVQPSQKETIIYLAGGRPGLALQLVKNPSLLEKEESIKKEIAGILEADLGSRFEKAKALSSQELEPVLTGWMRFFRAKVLAGLDKEKDALKQRKNLELLQRAFYLLKRTNINKKILLQNLMIKLER